MDREIKFKIWDKEKKCWYEPTYEAFAGRLEELLIMPCGDLCMRRFDTGTRTIEFIHQSNFMGRFQIVQFTGLGDIKGCPIYEGDIVSYTSKSGMSKIKQVWRRKASYHILSAKSSSKARLHNLLFAKGIYMSNLTVIGNVFENSNLLPLNP